MAPLKREPHRTKPSPAEPVASEWWVKDFRIFVPVNADSDVVEQRLPLSLRKALQQYAQQLASKVRGSSAKKCAKEQVGSKRGARRKGRSPNTPGLMDVILAGRCLSK